MHNGDERRQLGLRLEQVELSEEQLRVAYAELGEARVRLPFEQAMKSRPHAICIKNFALARLRRRGSVS